MNLRYSHGRIVPLPVTELIFQKLLAWADGLQEGAKRGELTPDGVFNLQYAPYASQDLKTDLA